MAKTVRTEERLSADALKDYLGSHDLDVTWSPVDPDPPDTRFDVTYPSGKREIWAVEITGLFQYTEWNGEEVNRRVFEPKLSKLCQRINRDKGSAFKCGYVVSVIGPVQPKVFKALEGRITSYIAIGEDSQEALDWPEAVASVEAELKVDPNDLKIRSTVNSVAADRCRVFIRPVERPRKLLLASLLDGAAGIPGSDKMVADLRAVLDYGLDRILNAKLPDLASIPGYDRRVLLIWSAVPGLEISEVVDSVSKRGLSQRDLDAVFLIDCLGTVHELVNNGLTM